MKYFLGIVLALGFCLNIQAQGEEIVLDKVVATVGDQIILLSQVEERYRGLEFKPENAWETTLEFNPDTEVSSLKRVKTWTRKILPKDIL